MVTKATTHQFSAKATTVSQFSSVPNLSINQFSKSGNEGRSFSKSGNGGQSMVAADGSKPAFASVHSVTNTVYSTENAMLDVMREMVAEMKQLREEVRIISD